MSPRSPSSKLHCGRRLRAAASIVLGLSTPKNSDLEKRRISAVVLDRRHNRDRRCGDMSCREFAQSDLRRGDAAQPQIGHRSLGSTSPRESSRVVIGLTHDDFVKDLRLEKHASGGSKIVNILHKVNSKARRSRRRRRERGGKSRPRRLGAGSNECGRAAPDLRPSCGENQAVAMGRRRVWNS